jgi:hypothetical protein
MVQDQAPVALAARHAREEVVLADAHTFVLHDPRTQTPYRMYVALSDGYAVYAHQSTAALSTLHRLEPLTVVG